MCQIAAAFAPMLLQPVKGILVGALLVESYTHMNVVTFQHTLVVNLVATCALDIVKGL